ncbi:MAG: hypothetical protein KatS3mg110_0991 [Pirellulaceae bacterium]|nr:MAG: hypothetical protein KatS3mg110_0991 [Pirellulaceae bacterium]
MADPIIHLKDAYFFEVPRFLWPRHFQSRSEFPDVWVRLDADFQQWEARRLCEELPQLLAKFPHGSLLQAPKPEELLARYEQWKADHHNFGKPLRVYLEEWRDRFEVEYKKWVNSFPDKVDRSLDVYVAECRKQGKDLSELWFVRLSRQPGFTQEWRQACQRAGDVAAYKTDPHVAEWSKEKIDAYNLHLSGKVLIPQPFGRLRNLHEPESGLCISKYMVIQFVVLLVLLAAYRWVAVRVANGDRPRGRWWNLLEASLVFVRDQIARPAMGSHDAERFVPLLWSMFLFILLSNLCGMIPGLGAPTSVWGNTAAMAAVTLATGIICGMRRFGPLGFFLNQIPHMDIPVIIGVVIKPVIFLIEMLSLAIKHIVLSVRLLANMVAGHLVLLGIMAMAFGFQAAWIWYGQPTWKWGAVALVVVVGSALFSLLELLVAFLQAYIFTFLSALFIGAAIHHH